MSIFKRILNNKKEKMQQGKSSIEQKENEIKDFDNSMYEEFEKMKLKVSKLETYIPERVEELREIVNDLQKSIQEIEEIKAKLKIEEQEQRQAELMKTIKGEKTDASLEFNGTNNIIEKEVQLELYFKSKKEVFNMKYNIINQEYLMKCVENFYKRINKVIYLEEAQKYEEYGEQNLLEDFKEYYNQLENQQDEFSGLQKNVFISKLKEVNYKLKMLEILQSGVYSKAIVKQWLESKTKADKIIDNRLLLNDVRRIKLECNKLKQAAREKGIDLKDEKINYIEQKVNTETIEDIENISEETIAEIIDILKVIRDYKLNLDKKISNNREEEKNEQKEIKQSIEYRKKENKMREKLIEIDNEDYDNAKSYKKIWKYEKDILEEEGLIDKKVLFENKNVKIIPIEKNRIPIILDNAKEKGISNYSICLEKDIAYFIKSKEDKIETEYSEFEYSKDNILIRKGEGRYSIATASYLLNKFDISIYVDDETSEFWGKYCKISSKDEKKLQETLQEYKNNANVDNIKFSLEVPYTRPILTILDKLRDNDIEYNILPPMDDHKEQTLRIYIDRKYLEKYKTQVHNQISNPETGLINICDEEVNIVELLLDNCKNVENLYSDRKLLDTERKK